MKNTLLSLIFVFVLLASADGFKLLQLFEKMQALNEMNNRKASIKSNKESLKVTKGESIGSLLQFKERNKLNVKEKYELERNLALAETIF